MGNKDSKVNVDKFLQIADEVQERGASGQEEPTGESKHALAAYLASLSDMAATGMVEHTHAGGGSGAGGGGSVAAAAPPKAAGSKDVSPETFRRMSVTFRHKLERRASFMVGEPSGDDLKKQLALLDSLLSQEDSRDWASMRSWMVWCMHSNLDDDDDSPTEIRRTIPSPRRGVLHRQTSLDTSRRRQLTQQSGFDLKPPGEMTPQTSLESNPES